MKMSDNLYFGYIAENGHPRLYSMDGKRMECSHDSVDRDTYLKLFTSVYEFQEPYLPVFYEAIQRRTLINGKAIYDKYIVDIPGLSSGAAGTAEVNGFKMHQIVNIIIGMIHGEWQHVHMVSLYNAVGLMPENKIPSPKVKESHVDVANYAYFRQAVMSKSKVKP